MADSNVDGFDEEFRAMGTVYGALKSLDADSQRRVLDYVASKLGVTAQAKTQPRLTEVAVDSPHSSYEEAHFEPSRDVDSADVDGVSPAGKKWITRNDFDIVALGKLFSIGGDEIDLIAKAVPGKSIRERMKNVFLLKGVSSYLSTGAARFAYEDAKEACLHYKAYDSSNFAAHLKAYSGEVGGTKETGFSLTNRGLSAATDLISSMIKGV